MQYSFQLLPHPNFHYQEALGDLARAELGCMMATLGCPVDIDREQWGDAAFLTFTSPELKPETLSRLAEHSSLLMLFSREGEFFRPLNAPRADYLPRELSEVLKYKGKTSATFTRMLLNLARAAAGLLDAPAPITVLDPLCGRGTTAFCALEMGMNAVGVDVDRRDLQEAMRHLSRYCALRRVKHSLRQSSETCGSAAVPAALYTLADTKEHYAAGDTRTLRFLQADTALAGPLLRRRRADILVADLPYGVQHAPEAGRKPEGFVALLERALPSWQKALHPGGAAAVSFNTLTLPRDTLIRLMEGAGFRVMQEEPYGPMAHFVEQAVVRDVVVARTA